jgi:leader peptidase (prepilin peptidase)/N-methyltransferase
VISYLVLRGRCASCHQAISLRYPLVEALTGILFVLVFRQFGFQWATPVYWLLAAALVVITFIDLDHQIIPDVISLPGIPMGLALTFLVPWISWSESLLGILLGGGSLYLVGQVYYLVTRVEGMGGGDVKLLAMMGAFLGWKAVLPTIFLGSLVGSIIGVSVMLYRRAGGKLAIPFGPFLALGAVIYLLYGQDLLRWYLSLFQTGGGFAG